ncbi:MAG: tRNA (adenosine(37)-N6)-threonylcarbamoyltransferase complex ATPase subunit type 1 TsaE [Bacteroidales bacterium]|nr:tRNA (adenosine(37)-N6)-threonylcarbamoyltransferase complex ATPase subunit type 1 TsaE [Bacteroidales bacterium]
MPAFEISSLHQLEHASEYFLKITKGHKKFAFTGVMGSGKTTFINAVCRRIGVINLVTSPTFALVNEYQTFSGELVYHFDFYRIKSITEAFDLGYEEYFYSDAWCFVEWAEKAAELISEEFVRVHIEVLDDNTRRISVEL